MTAFRLALAAALSVASPAATAQPPAAPSAPAAAPAAAARPWQVDWGQYYCSAIRKADANRPFATAFVTIPGMRGMHIALLHQGDGQMPAGITDVVLLPAGRSFGVAHSEERNEQTDIQRLYNLPTDFLDQLAAAEAMLLKTDGRVRARVPLDGVRGALGAHRRCVTTVAAEWGVDLAALAALTRRPDSTNGLGLRWEDYPLAALRRASQGRVAVRIDVSTAGRATACATVASSGSPEIDRVACQSALTRGRFQPALDAHGQPVAVRAVFMVTFRLPDG